MFMMDEIPLILLTADSDLISNHLIVIIKKCAQKHLLACSWTFQRFSVASSF